MIFYHPNYTSFVLPTLSSLPLGSALWQKVENVRMDFFSIRRLAIFLPLLAVKLLLIYDFWGTFLGKFFEYTNNND